VVEEPSFFDDIRKFWNLTPENILKSFEAPLNAVNNQGGSSGSFFYLTYDKKFFLKSLPFAEYDLFKKYSQDYSLFMQNNPNSLLTRFMGLYTITIHSQTTYFTMMENLLPDFKLDEIYDLKGSKANRKGKEGGGIKKDLDMRYGPRRRNFPAEKGGVKLGPKLRTLMLEQIKKDSNFLMTKNIMDYSLLVGITTVTKLKQQNIDFSKGIVSTDENDNPLEEVYFMGIIDIMQEFNAMKKGENMIKSFIYKQNEISSVDANLYYERFNVFMEGLFTGFKD